MSSESINSYSGSKESFFGNGNLKQPDALYRNLDNSSGFGVDSAACLEFIVKLDKNEEKEIIILLGVTSDKEKIKEISDNYLDSEKVNSQKEKRKNYWEDILSTVKIKTPDEALNIMMNGWLVYQTISSRLLAKTGYYQSGGATGFRDQLQDAIGIALIDSNYLKKQLLLAIYIKMK